MATHENNKNKDKYSAKTYQGLKSIFSLKDLPKTYQKPKKAYLEAFNSYNEYAGFGFEIVNFLTDKDQSLVLVYRYPEYAGEDYLKTGVKASGIVDYDASYNLRVLHELIKTEMEKPTDN